MYTGSILIIFECKKGLYLMNAIINFLITVLIVFFISCEKSILDSSALSDAQIIEMIMESDKIEISIEDMPDNSQAIVNQEYTDYMKISSKKASDLGLRATSTVISPSYSKSTFLESKTSIAP